MKRRPAARGDDFAPAYNKVRAQVAKGKAPVRDFAKPTAPVKAMQAASYVRQPQLVNKIKNSLPQVAKSAPLKTFVKPKFKQYGDKGYKPSNGVGVGY